MSTSSSPPALAPASQARRPLPRLPEARFWKRYSPHHELPLSTVSSVALHVLTGGCMILLAIYFGRLHEERDRPVEVGTVRVDGPEKGDHKAAGPALGTQGDGDLPPAPEEATPTGGQDIPRAELPFRPAQPTDLPKPSDEDLKTTIAQDNPSPIAIVGLSPKKRADLLTAPPGSGRPVGPGQNGKGPGGAEGGGPNGQIKRLPRQLRWVMNFNTRDGRDYAQQLRELGAILAIPLPPKPGEPVKGIVIRDLSKPSEMSKEEDLTALNLIGWKDDQPQSTAALANALGIKPPPPVFIAYFPRELEERLAKLERDKLEKDHPGKSESDITETVFEVVTMGGKYQPRIFRMAVK
jgi:hypothetical protein